MHFLALPFRAGNSSAADWYNRHMDSSKIWPPPPDLPMPLVAKEVRAQWFRPALWLGLAFNILACFPSMWLLQYPSGIEMMSDDLDTSPIFLGIVPVATAALLIGIPIALWLLRKRRGNGQSILWECVGLFLCLTPLFTGLGVLYIVVKVKAFDSIA